MYMQKRKHASTSMGTATNKLDWPQCTVAPYSCCESQPPPKRPFLTPFSKIHGPTKIEKLGTWQNSIRFRNLWPFIFVLYWGTLGLLLMSLQWHHIYQVISMNGPAL